MQYRRLGTSGLKLSAFSLGAWITFGTSIGRSEARELIHRAFDVGINFFDNAETYANGEAERIMGDVIADLRLPRDAFCVSSKVFFGAAEKPRPTQKGLSRKHLRDACDGAMQRLRVEYLDLYFAHRPDPEVPIAETVWAMDQLVRAGKVLYWGTSEWPVEAIAEAHRIAQAHQLVAPVMEQPQYNLLHRTRVEQEYAPLYRDHGMGTTIWSPLASGVLTGKYNDAKPCDSRLERPGYEWLQRMALGESGERTLDQVRRFVALAKELGHPPHRLALAWCLRNPNVSTVLLGVSRIEQLDDNLKALPLVDAVSPTDWLRVEACFAT
ncbi:MAG: aldo/keto reductase [Lysobacterales bacterium]